VSLEDHWTGTISTNLGGGCDPIIFTLRLKDFVAAKFGPEDGTFGGYGSSHNGQEFKIHNGEYRDKPNECKTRITFDIVYRGQPTEKFRGYGNYSSSDGRSIEGTVTLKDTWSPYQPPPEGHEYEGSVFLNSAE
jgi:hypothetical protein